MTVISLGRDIVDGTRVVIDVIIISEDGMKRCGQIYEFRKQKVRRDNNNEGILIFEKNKGIYNFNYLSYLSFISFKRKIGEEKGFFRIVTS